MDSFSMKTRILMGDGLGELAQTLKRVFIVTDPFMRRVAEIILVKSEV